MANFIRRILIVFYIFQERLHIFCLALTLPFIFYGCMFDYAGGYSLSKSSSFTAVTIP